MNELIPYISFNTLCYEFNLNALTVQSHIDTNVKFVDFYDYHFKSHT